MTVTENLRSWARGARGGRYIVVEESKDVTVVYGECFECLLVHGSLGGSLR